MEEIKENNIDNHIIRESKCQRRLRLNRESRRRRRRKNPEKYKEIDRKRKTKHVQKLKTLDNGTGYKLFLERRREREKPQSQKQRDELHDTYLKNLLIDKGFKKNEITEEEINNIRKQLSLKRALRPQRRQVRYKKKELTAECSKEKALLREHLESNKLKRCYKCRKLKHFDDFIPCRIKNPTYNSFCMSCEKMIYEQKNKGEKNEQTKKTSRVVEHTTG